MPNFKQLIPCLKRRKKKKPEVNQRISDDESETHQDEVDEWLEKHTNPVRTQIDSTEDDANKSEEDDFYDINAITPMTKGRPKSRHPTPYPHDILKGVRKKHEPVL
jgi:hypothetical protein